MRLSPPPHVGGETHWSGKRNGGFDPEHLARSPVEVGQVDQVLSPRLAGVLDLEHLLQQKVPEVHRAGEGEPGQVLLGPSHIEHRQLEGGVHGGVTAV